MKGTVVKINCQTHEVEYVEEDIVEQEIEIPRYIVDQLLEQNPDIDLTNVRVKEP
jgi:hypothetical protein